MTKEYEKFWSNKPNKIDLFESSDFFGLKKNWEKGEYKNV